ncbi:MAG: SCO family protein [Betaproteobacteria bacterium]|nr:MAG: SCO family protein [Betaproteobacteria bacterium]
MKGAALLAALVAAPALAHHVELLPPLQFVPPRPGSYQLHRIMPAPDGRVLDVDGRAARLSQYLHDRITLLGFIYTTCADPDGCPLAYRVFDALKEAIAATPRLQGQVRFVTLSFDPARDTPEAMRRYAGSRVVGFGQDVRVTAAGRELSHVLKVFLIDRRGDIREIYSSNFLHPQSVLNDIETLLLEEGKSRLDRP